MSFLTAEWRKLVFANYVIDPKVLEPYIPFGTELDLWQDKCYISLVGFMFVDVRLLGIKIPFHVNFEEVNLRFYVRRLEKGEWKRGVVFIKEIVPKPAITFVANTIYQENYQTLEMRHRWEETDTSRVVEYQWKMQQDWFTFQVNADRAASVIEPGGETEFITEHYWGYAHAGPKKSNEYEVTHPKWEQYKVNDYQIDVDYGKVYGPDFAFLNQEQPSTVMLAEGSAITVEGKRKISE
jgi:uncharacterized protein YqjF (DUF2071 family)